MVQVDVFMTFAFSASFAVAAGKQLKKEEKPFYNEYFVKILSYLTLIFVPIGVYLITQFPGWESMFALYPYLVNVSGSPPGIIPHSAGFIIAAISFIYVLSGIFGYYLAYRFIRADNMKAAHALWLIGFAVIPLIVLIGWDGTGFERFIFAGTWHEWHQWKVLGGENPYKWIDFFFSKQFMALLVMGVIAIPPALYFYWKWPEE